MSQPPPPFERSFSFTDHSVNTPDLQQPGQKIDQELNNVRSTVNQTVSRLSEIQRDDGKLRDEFVSEAVAGAVDAAELERQMAEAARLDTYTARSEVLAAETHVVAIADGIQSLASQTLVDAQAAVLSAEAEAQAAALSATASSGSAVSSSTSASNAYNSELAASASALTATNKAGEAAASALSATNSAVNAAASAASIQTLTFASPLVKTGNVVSADLSAYYLASNPTGYITSSALTSYATQSYVTSQGYITSSALTPYITIESASATYFPKPTGTLAQYIAGDGTIQLFPSGQAATRMETTIFNNTGATIPAFSVVYINGSHGTLPTVALAKADIEETSRSTFGFTETAIADQDSGSVVQIGLLEGVNTQAYADGDLLYVSPTVAGGFTNVQPYSPYHYVCVGTVVRAHPTLGQIQVKVSNSNEFSELSDVQVTAAVTGDLLVKNASGYWVGQSKATAGIATFQASNTFTANQIIEVTDNANAALRVTQLGTGEAFRVEDSANPDNSPFVIDASGNVGIGTTTVTAKLTLNGNANFSGGTGGTLYNFTQNSTGTLAAFQNNATSTADCVRITNLGTGNSFVVEDSTNPDSTPFVISADGRVGISGASLTANLNLVGNFQVTNGTISISNAGSAGGIVLNQTNTGTTSAGVIVNYAGTADAVRITNTGTGASFRVEDSTNPDASPFVVDAGGNVGVKTLAPSTDFEVTGNIKTTTAEITSAPAAGDSSTKVPTTAWVQSEVPAASTLTAGKVQLATSDEAIAGTDTTKAVTAEGLNKASWLESYDQQDMSAVSFNAGVTGGMTVLQGMYKNLNHNASTAIGSAFLACLNFNQAGNVSGINGGIDWTKKVTFSFVLSRSTVSPSSGCVFRACLGKSQAGGGVGDLIATGIGIKIEGSGVVQLMAYRSGALVTTNTTFTPNGIEVFAVKLVSYGNGTVECFINGNSVGTNTNSPNAISGAFLYNGTFECQQVAAVTTTATWTVTNIKQSFGKR